MSFKWVRFIAAITLTLYGLLLWYALTHVVFNNDYWLPEDNVYQQQMMYLEDEFLPGFGATIVLDFGTSFFSESNIALVERVTQSIRSVQYVTHVLSPLDAMAIYNANDSLHIQSYAEARQDGHIKTLAEYESLFIDSPYYGMLVSKNHHVIAIPMSIKKRNDDRDLVRRTHAVDAIHAILRDLPQSVHAFITGDAAIFYDMDKESLRNLSILLPLALIFLVGTIRLLLFQWRRVCVVIIPTLANLGLVPIVLALIGHPITIINITLFVLILVITVADGIHMLNYWDIYKRNNQSYPIVKMIQSTWLPCLITSLTTAIGFGSFVVSDIIPLRQYGLQSFITISVAYIHMMTLVPLMIRLTSPDCVTIHDTRLFLRLADGLIGFVRKYDRTIFWVGSLITICFVQFLWLSKTETSFISVFFQSNHPVQRQVQYVDDQLGGSGRLNLIQTATESVKEVDRYNQLVSLRNMLLQHDLVQDVQGIFTPVRMVHAAFQTDGSLHPKTNDELEQALLFLEFSRGDTQTDALHAWVDFDYTHAHLEIITDQLSTPEVNQLVTFIQDTVDKSNQLMITGGQYLSYVLGKYVLKTQFITIGVTFLFVWILFVALFGVRLGSFGMVSNIIPMVVTLSLLPLMGLSFDFATVLISSVALGLAVDDTIHWLYYYKQSPSKIRELDTIKVMVTPLLVTSIVLVVGFIVLSVSNMVILKKFGVFTSIAIVIAWVSDMIFLPALLRVFKRPDDQSLQQE